MSTTTTTVGGLRDAINSLAETVVNTVNQLMHGRVRFTVGNYVYVTHPSLDDFHGHIAELPTSETVVVTRESDGVLVHVTRECVGVSGRE